MNTCQEALVYCLAARLNVLLIGEPGTAKTAIITQIAGAVDRHLETIIASIHEPSDFGGLPVLDNGGYRLAAGAWARRLCEHTDPVLFIDEISTAPPAVQAALLRVVLDGVVGETVLPRATSYVAACNPTDHSAGGWVMSAPLANRWVHVPWVLPPKDWSEGLAAGEWPVPEVPQLPEGWQQTFGPTERASVAAFINRKSHLMCVVPDDEISQGGAWPSPRTWTMAAEGMAACRAGGASDEAEMMIVAGCIGEQHAIEFLTWRRDLDLPDPEELIADPMGAPLPLDRGDKAYVVLSGVAAAAIRDKDEPRWKAGWKVLARAANEGAKDVAASAARTLARNLPGNVTSAPPEAAAFASVLRAAGLMRKRK